tara:strand:+ start:32 stop:214 length:183 start_codon:yes stop_codon:yes gene_type:complete
LSTSVGKVVGKVVGTIGLKLGSGLSEGTASSPEQQPHDVIRDDPAATASNVRILNVFMIM